MCAGQPQYTITSTGQLQMQPGTGQPGQPTFIMGPAGAVMQSPIPGQVSIIIIIIINIIIIIIIIGEHGPRTAWAPGLHARPDQGQ